MLGLHFAAGLPFTRLIPLTGPALGIGRLRDTTKSV